MPPTPVAPPRSPRTCFVTRAWRTCTWRSRRRATRWCGETGRGRLFCLEAEAQGAALDLHSGAYGGAAPNPFNALAWITAGLKDPAGRVTIPGFYDRVVPPSDAEMESWKRLGIDEDLLLKDEIGSDAFFGEADYPVLYRLYARPTLDVHGIRGGFNREGGHDRVPAPATRHDPLLAATKQRP